VPPELDWGTASISPFACATGNAIGVIYQTCQVVSMSNLEREDDFGQVRARLAERWAHPDLPRFASAPGAAMLAAPGDWDPPAGVLAKRTPLTLSVGIPDAATLPRGALSAAMQNVLAETGDAALRYGFGLGYPPLRMAIAERYRAAHPVPIDEDWVQVTNGASGAIDLLLRAVIEPGDVIVTESPVYMGTLRNFRALQARIVPVPVDSNGLRIDRLQETLAHLARDGERAKVVYTISSFQNPTGATLSLPRRRALLELAAEYGFLILDDEVYADLYYEAKPLPSLLELGSGYGVVSVGSFSKTVATGLRIGWIMAHPDIVQLITRMRFDMGQNQLGVRMMANFMAADALEPHLHRLRSLYRDKMTTIAAALEREAGDLVTFTRPKGGFYLWAQLRDGLGARDVWRTAMEEGVAVNAGHGFRAGSEPEGEFLRIAFAWTPAEDLEEAALRVAAACRRVAAGDVA
jgi:2-aminoadipate transaminase